MAMMEKFEKAFSMLSNSSIPEEAFDRESEHDATMPMGQQRNEVDIKAELLASELRLAFESHRLNEQTPKKNRIADVIGKSEIFTQQSLIPIES